MESGVGQGGGGAVQGMQEGSRDRCTYPQLEQTLQPSERRKQRQGTRPAAEPSPHPDSQPCTLPPNSFK